MGYRVDRLWRALFGEEVMNKPKLKCPYCGCELKIPDEDSQKEFRKVQDLPSHFSYAICPICDVMFLLENGKIVDEFEVISDG